MYGSLRRRRENPEKPSIIKKSDDANVKLCKRGQLERKVFVLVVVCVMDYMKYLVKKDVREGCFFFTTCSHLLAAP